MSVVLSVLLTGVLNLVKFAFTLVLFVIKIPFKIIEVITSDRKGR